MKREILKFVILLAVALGAAPAYSAFWMWSKTAATNATADPSINWSEGMSPSSVNDSARAMMARAAEYRDDISGALSTTGTSTAYLLATNQGLPSTPNTGQMIAFKPNVTNGVAATLTADGGTTYPLQSSPGTALPDGSIIAGTPYRASFSGTAWVMNEFYSSPTAVPLGGVMYTTLSTAPNSSFISPNGQCISTTTYAVYWVAMGSPAPGSCAAGQFQTLDLAGRVIAALDTLPGSVARNRLTNSATGCGVAFTTVGAVCTENQSTTLLAANLPNVTSTNAAQAISVTSNITNIIVGSLLSVGAFTGSGVTIAVGVTQNTPTASGNNSISVTSTGTTSTPFSRVQPTIGLVPWLRVI